MAEMRNNEDVNALTKIQQWPVVSDSWGKLTSFYSRTKESNRLVNFTMGKAEAGLKAAVHLATPVVTPVLSKPMITINEVTCRQLDKLEQTYPIVTKPTNEVLDETKKKFEPIVSRFHQAQKYGNDSCTVVKEKVQHTKDYVDTKRNSGQHVVHDRTLGLINVVEFYVDKYLPPVEGEEEPLNEEEKGVVMKRARVLGRKMQGRLSHYALKQIRAAKARSQETVNSMYKVDLMEYARTNMGVAQEQMAVAKLRAQDMWAQHMPTSEQVRSAVGEERLKALRTRLAEMRELSRRGVATMWQTTVNYADNALAFVTMNKLTITQIGALASNFTAASVDTARIYGEMLKEHALNIMGKKHEKLVIEMTTVVPPVVPGDFSYAEAAAQTPADDAPVKASAETPVTPVQPSAPAADDTLQTSGGLDEPDVDKSSDSSSENEKDE